MDDKPPFDESIDPSISRTIDGSQRPVKGPDIESEPQAISLPIAAQRARRLGPAGRRAALMRARRAPPVQIGVWAALACVILLLASVFRPPHHGRSAWREYATAPGQRASVTLPDGTKFTLAPASHLRVPVDYASGNRGVMLDGEAFFAVVHDAAHPFSVRAGHTVVTDIGTEFDVHAYADDRTVRVAVVEGSVGVSAGNAATLGAGDLAVVDTGITITRSADVTAATSWTHGRLVFNRAPMRDALATVGRWYDLDLRVSDPAMWAEPFTGSFSTESVDQVIATFALILHAQAERSGHTVVFTAKP
jgi:ferric-dicitrate binding protein FerR (iron transport regulator)